MVLSIYTGGVILFTGFTLLPVSPLNSSIIKHLLFTAEIRSTFFISVASRMDVHPDLTLSTSISNTYKYGSYNQ